MKPSPESSVCAKSLTHRKGKGSMNSDIHDIAKWARSQAWRVENDSKGYTRFYDPRGNYVTCYPATPSNARRRMQDLQGKLKKAGLPWPAPGKKEQRSQRKKGGAK